MVNGPTGPLAEGWHRVTWTQLGGQRYVVTECIASAAMLASLLEVRARDDVALESWSDYPCVDGVFVPQDDVPRETSAEGDPIVAYTVGSFWFCTSDAHLHPEAHPVRRSQLMDGVYDYYCDDCSKAIGTVHVPRETLEAES